MGVPATSPKPRFRVAICGAGIAGLALATVLGKYEQKDSPLEVTIYERQPEMAVFGAGISVWQRTWRVMQLLGIDDQLARASERPPVKAIGPGFVYRRADRTNDTYNYYTVMLPYGSSTMHRADLVQVLLQNVPQSYSIRMGKRLVSYTEVVDGYGDTKYYELQFTDGTTAEADVVIGADGIKSAVRMSMYDAAHRQDCAAEVDRGHCPRCSAATPKWTGIITYRALIPTEKLRAIDPEHQGFRYTLCRRQHVVSYPVSHGGFINWIGFKTRPEMEGTIYEGKSAEEAPKEEIWSSSTAGRKRVHSQCVEKPTRWVINMISGLPFSVRGRAALLGDAVHAMETHLGAGAGQSIEDAYILGRLLAHPLTTLDRVHDVLRIYQSVRLSFANTIFERARETGRMCEFNWPGQYDGNECLDEREQLEQLGKSIYRNWQWQWRESFDEQWDVAEWAIEQFLHVDAQKVQAE
ncbi:uncharacterized protein B0H18DRAFT_1086308 [Fomitopsis serialis]|uniref:uncharacterized protein n=1 Tax=Fomitopsis serialis TaxID=139415 RepID=UPI002008131C|nr:uncharacterized protein B0H18DRAFT_1086308 [Neoantrodia serialis]KAH9920776.1 hypothetical protein B0H18DRAFT_1086308 [Neoantrodia serialis]